MELKKNLIIPFLASFFILILSFFISFIPCRFAPRVPNPHYTWSLCSLDPESSLISSSFIEYFGITSSLKMSYLILIFSVFLICFLLNHFIFSKLKHKK